MKASITRHRSWMTAIAFAEAGEWETAREMMPVSRPNNNIGWLERMFMAAAFAESGLPEEAVRLVGNRQPSSRAGKGLLESMGFRGTQVAHGILAPKAQ